MYCRPNDYPPYGPTMAYGYQYIPTTTRTPVKAPPKRIWKDRPTNG